MLIELGNARPHERIGDQFVALADNPSSVNEGEPAVTQLVVPNDYTFDPHANVADLALHLARNPDVTQLPGNEAFVAVVRAWPQHSADSPTWVWSDDEAMAELLANFYGCPVGRPDDVEDTHHTIAGPPGVGPKE